jgi:hypothetical protein
MLFWPYPLMALLNRQLTLAREEVCDNYVLLHVPGPQYAQTLFDLSERIHPLSSNLVQVGLLQHYCPLERRVAGLLDMRRNIMTKINRLTMCGLAALLLTTMIFAAGTRLLKAQAVDTLPDKSLDMKSAEAKPEKKPKDEFANIRAKDQNEDLRGLSYEFLPPDQRKSAKGLSPLIQKRAIEKSMKDFPEKTDLSTPESALASWMRFAGAKTLNDLSWRKWEDRYLDEKYWGTTPKYPTNNIVEVLIYGNELAEVIFEESDADGNLQYMGMYFGKINDRWKLLSQFIAGFSELSVLEDIFDSKKDELWTLFLQIKKDVGDDVNGTSDVKVPHIAIFRKGADFGVAIQRRAVNKLVKDFPEEADLSTPESAYAAIEQSIAKNSLLGIKKMTWTNLYKLLAGENASEIDDKYIENLENDLKYDPHVPKDLGKMILEQEILQVLTYRDDLAEILVKSDIKLNPGGPYGAVYLGKIHGQWKALSGPGDFSSNLEDFPKYFEQSKETQWNLFQQAKKDVGDDKDGITEVALPVLPPKDKNIPVAIREYTVNKLVKDFPEKTDLSTPESAYAAVAHLCARKNIRDIEKLSWTNWKKNLGIDLKEVEDNFRDDPHAPADYSKMMLETEVLQVFTYRDDLAEVISKSDLDLKYGHGPYGACFFGKIHGTWKCLTFIEKSWPNREEFQKYFEDNKESQWNLFQQVKKDVGDDKDGKTLVDLRVLPFDEKMTESARKKKETKKPAASPAMLDESKRDARKTEVIQLKATDPQTTALSLKTMLGISSDAKDIPADAPKIEADIAKRQLLIEGTEEQIAQIRQVLEKLGETNKASAIQRREVNKLVKDFPEKTDISTPESALAAYHRAESKKDIEAVLELEWKERLTPRQLAEIKQAFARKLSVADWTTFRQALLDAEVIEVDLIADLAGVITKLDFSEGIDRGPFSMNVFGRIDGQWKNLDEGRFPTVEAARKDFAKNATDESGLLGYFQATKEVVKSKQSKPSDESDVQRREVNKLVKDFPEKTDLSTPEAALAACARALARKDVKALFGELGTAGPVRIAKLEREFNKTPPEKVADIIQAYIDAEIIEVLTYREDLANVILKTKAEKFAAGTGGGPYWDMYFGKIDNKWKTLQMPEDHALSIEAARENFSRKKDELWNKYLDELKAYTPDKKRLAVKSTPSDKEQLVLMGLVENFFVNNSRDFSSRKTLEWGEAKKNEDGSRSIHYKFAAQIADGQTMTADYIFTFDKDDVMLGYKDADGPPIVENFKGQIETTIFLKVKDADISAWKSLDWGDVERDKEGNLSIRYKYEATIGGAERRIMNQIFTFDKNHEFVGVKNVEGYPKKESKSP